MARSLATSPLEKMAFQWWCQTPGVKFQWKTWARYMQKLQAIGPSMLEKNIKTQSIELPLKFVMHKVGIIVQDSDGGEESLLSVGFGEACGNLDSGNPLEVAAVVPHILLSWGGISYHHRLSVVTMVDKPTNITRGEPPKVESLKISNAAGFPVCLQRSREKT